MGMDNKLTWEELLKNEAQGLARLVAAAKFSQQGFVSAYRSEAAFRQEVWVAAVLLPLAFFVADTPLEWLALVVPLLLLLAVELLNTAIEALVDRMGEEYHALAAVAKDCGSCAVLILVLVLVVSWIAVFIN